MTKKIKLKESNFKLIVSLTDCLDYVFNKKRKVIDDEYGYELFVKQSVSFIFNRKDYCRDFHFAIYLNTIYKDLSAKAPPWDPIIQVAQNDFTLYLSMLVEKFKAYRILEILRAGHPEITHEIRSKGNETEIDIIIPKTLTQV
jgi:hypothetical protein